MTLQGKTNIITYNCAFDKIYRNMILREMLFLIIPLKISFLIFRKLGQIYTTMERTKAEAKAKIAEETAKERNEEAFTLEHIRELGEEARKEIIELVGIVVNHISRGINYIIHSRDGMKQMVSLVLAISALSFCIYAVKEGISLTFSILQTTFSRPRLIREYHKKQRFFFRIIRHTHHIQNGIQDIVLSPRQEERIAFAITTCVSITAHYDKWNWISSDINTSVLTSRRRGSHLLLYGPPGTGKTKTAKYIAQALSSCYPSVILSGADILPLGSSGPLELRKVLTWANAQSGGALIIIDEAESALGTRATKSTEDKHDNFLDSHSNSNSFTTDALNVFLSMTGTNESNCMLILTTCYPEALDEAVLDRMDELILLSLPSQTERLKILNQEFSKVFENTCTYNDGSYPTFSLKRAKNKCGNKRNMIFIDENFKWEKALEELSHDQMTHGLSGRELCQIIRYVESEIYCKCKYDNHGYK